MLKGPWKIETNRGDMLKGFVHQGRRCQMGRDDNNDDLSIKKY